MAKDLQTSVILETKTAEKKLQALVDAINSVDNAINKAGKSTNTLSQELQKSINNANKLKSAQNNITKQVKATNREYQKQKSILTSISQIMKHLVGAYVGLEIAGASIKASDTITKSENKLNQINGGDKKATQAQMDAMYAAAQRSRMGYGDMMANVSKSMTLSPDAFGGDMNAAIAFQEVMAKSYALGGASQAEQSSSMYQMIQALGSGKLAGDELRSVTEGAPLAAKEIEKFAQEIYKTDMALKDMGSRGMITSEMVVAAMLSAGEELDKQFQKTAMTFEQAWQRIKNTALKAFEPVLQKMNQILNSDVGQAILDGIGRAIEIVANALNYLLTKLEDVYNYIVDHWETVKTILLILASIIGTRLVLTTGQLIVKLWQLIATSALAGASWLAAWWPLVLVIGVLIYLVYQWANSTQTATDFIYGILYSLAMAIIGMMAVVLAVYLATGAIILSIPLLIVLVIIGILAMLIAIFLKHTSEVVGIAYGLCSSVAWIFENIGNIWNNMLQGMIAGFWGFVSDCLTALQPLVEAFNSLAGLFGGEGINISGAIDSANAKADAANAKKVDLSGGLSNAWKTGYANGAKVGTDIHNKINETGEKFKGLLNGSGGSSLPSVGGSYAYDPTSMLGDIADSDAKTAGNTGKMADAMELAEEDLALLLDLAEMEWKKEFTTANITVDMSNYNTINGNNDLDGIVTYLRDGLIEEMSAVANGAYAF